MRGFAGLIGAGVARMGCFYQGFWDGEGMFGVCGVEGGRECVSVWRVRGCVGWWKGRCGVALFFFSAPDGFVLGLLGLECLFCQWVDPVFIFVSGFRS